MIDVLVELIQWSAMAYVAWGMYLCLTSTTRPANRLVQRRSEETWKLF